MDKVIDTYNATETILECNRFPPKYGMLPENFIQNYMHAISRNHALTYAALSEELIRNFMHAGADIYNAAKYQKLSEGFIEEFQSKLDWDDITFHQVLSENFMRKFSSEINWFYVSVYQKLSEDFIREFQDEVNWFCVLKYQELSEIFIREFKHLFSINDWPRIVRYQKLSNEFIEEFELEIPDTCWLYKTPEWKEKYIREHTTYPIENGMIIAYKSTKSNGYSAFTPRYKYEIGKEYESTADYNQNYDNSFGLSAWTKLGALSHYENGKLFKVGIKPEDLACVVRGYKLRATKIKILEEVPHAKKIKSYNFVSSK